MKSNTLFPLACLCLFPIFLKAQICDPSVTALNGLSVDIHPIDTDGDQLTDTVGAVLRISDLILRADSPCNPGTLQFGMRKSGTGTGWTADTSLFYSCDELGTQLVELWVRNASGRSNYSETYIIVQDNSGECGVSPAISTQCANDILFPEIFSVNGLSAPLRKTGSGEPMLRVGVSAFVKSVYDNCGGPYQFRLRKSGTGTGAPADSTVTFNCDEQGTQLVEVWAGDPAGNWNYSETYVIVQDNHHICGNNTPAPVGCSPDRTPPELLVYNGFAQGVTWGGIGPSARFYAKDFIRYAHDKCHDNLGWRIRKSGAGAGVPVNPDGTAPASVRFSCDELGTQLVEIWLRDGAGNWTWAETYVNVQDNTGSCGPGFAERAHVVIPEFKQEIIARAGGTPAGDRAARREGLLEPQLAVWPNPAAEGFNLAVRLGAEGFVSVHLYDGFGRLVRTLSGPEWSGADSFIRYYSRDGLQAGLYRCVVNTAQGVQTVSVVFQ